MEKYLVLCDLDDTLLTSDKKVTKESSDFIKEFNKSGNMFCICTGRPYQGAYEFYKDIGKSTPLVCDNGCSIYFKDEEPKFFGIEVNLFKELMDKLKDYSNSIYAVTGNKVTYSFNYNKVPDFIKHNELNDIVNFEDDFENAIYDVLIINLNIQDIYYDNVIDILESYKEEIEYTYWGNFLGDCGFEVRSIKGSKGNALKYLKDKYKFKDTHTLAFGDQLNDISMLKEAGFGVSMINANEEVKKVTKYQTEFDNNNNGVIEFIKKNKLY